MYTTLLINKIDYADNSDNLGNVFFMIGEMNKVESQVMDIIRSSDLVDESNVVYKYNGVDMKIRIQDIPFFVKSFTQAGLRIYNIYEEYEPS
ncbi:MAG: hypothetical protein GXZ11_00140 [Tissierellia bacterium]|nr:hypothetical protein [Tissierellia bacterium]